MNTALSFSIFSDEEWQRLNTDFLNLDRKRLLELIRTCMIVNEIKKDKSLLKEFHNKLNANIDKE